MEFSTCPICNLSIPSLELQQHANDHFADEDEARDLELAQKISLIPPSPPPTVNDSLKSSPGFLDSGESSSSSCDSKVTAFGRNINDEKCASLVQSQKKEIFYIVEGGLMSLLRKCLELESENSTSVLCGHVDHFQSIKSWDVGWGCGWRNIQMLSSYLIRQCQETRKALYGGFGFVPDIGSLQRWLELAWVKGFDTSGSDEFCQSIYGKRNWIGTTECAALFRSFGLRARIVDFSSRDFELAASDTYYSGKRKNTQAYGPMDIFLSTGKLDSSLKVSFGKESHGDCGVSSEKVNGHHVLSEWVWNYFTGSNANKSGNNHVVLSEKAPLYFQHDGHSRTIIGIQAKHQKNGMQQYNLLILDPAEKTSSLERSLRENAGWQKLIKRGVHTLRKPQYQLCFIDPGIANGKELEGLKILHSIRHEF